MNSSSHPHIVQVSRDWQLLETNQFPEPIQRQEYYLSQLRLKCPNLQMTILVRSRSKLAPFMSPGGVRIQSTSCGPLLACLRVPSLLKSLHEKRRIWLITTQTLTWESISAAIFARYAAIPVVGQLHSDPFRTNSFKRRFLLAVAPKVIRVFDRIRVVSQSLFDSLATLYPSHLIFIAPVPSFPATENRKELSVHGVKLPERFVLFVGRFVQSKRIDVWLDIAARIAEIDTSVHFVMVGAGEHETLIDKLVEEGRLGERLIKIPWCDRADLDVLFSRASAQLVTSESEGFCRVVNEGFSCGLPCVATDLPTLRDRVIDDETGFLFDLNRPQDGAARVLSILADKSLQQRLSVAARLKALDYSADKLSAVWLKQLLEIGVKNIDNLVEIPSAPSVERWRRISFSPFTILRFLQYEAIKGLKFRGEVLDLGGGRKASYLDLIQVDGNLLSLNICPSIEPSVLCDLNHPLPLRSESVNHVISLNTFEHLYNDAIAVRESLRVLKVGGTFHFLVPFLYQVHASPSDFNRRTAFWWAETLERAGASEISIRPLVWDRLSSAFSIIGGGRLARLLRPLIMVRGVLMSKIRDLLLLPNYVPSDFKVPLGYYVQGKKGDSLDKSIPRSL